MSVPHPLQSDEPTFGHDMRPLYNLVYCSRSTVDEAGLQAILATAKRCNPLHGVTGLLVFGGGIFFQWLEGPRAAVTRLMDNLKGDPRHGNIVILSELEEVRERLFPDWDMELVTTDDIRGVLADARDEATDPKNAEALAHLLDQLDSGELRELSPA